VHGRGAGRPPGKTVRPLRADHSARSHGNVGYGARDVKHAFGFLRPSSGAIQTDSSDNSRPEDRPEQDVVVWAGTEERRRIMSTDITESIGFIGLGAMGEPMALNLAKSGKRLVVWNRTHAKSANLAAAGAAVAASATEVLAACPTVFLMVSDGGAIDAVLARYTAELANRVAGRMIINMATVSPSYSKALEADIRAAGGHYVEAPVSGSRKPAEAGQLVAMLAGDVAAIERVRPLSSPMCRAVVPCGVVPRALSMKFAVNIFLIASITGLAEAAHFAKAQGLDMSTWGSIVNSSQMASDISRVKVEKLLSGDLEAQAAIINVLETNRLIAEAAHESGIPSPLMDACLTLYRRTNELGLGQSDMISVVRALEDHARSSS
jgi:3-hydroxyisobutyrate dehydrogenase